MKKGAHPLQSTKVQSGCAPIFTIGHSHHTIELFIELLKKYGVAMVVDVRSTPASRFAPHFNREQIKGTLKVASVRYTFMGDVLGGRPSDKTCWENNHVSYTKLKQHPPFESGVERVLNGSRKGLTVALMCAETDPIDCHRSLAIGRALTARGAAVQHIHGDGSVETQAQLEELRLLKKFGLDSGLGLFDSSSNLLTEAYAKQEAKIAYRQSRATDLAKQDGDSTIVVIFTKERNPYTGQMEQLASKGVDIDTLRDGSSTCFSTGTWGGLRPRPW